MDFVLRNLSLTFPITNPVLIFSLVLFVLLLTPILQQKFKIPNIIALIIAGLVLGEHGLGVLSRDDSFELFGTVGLIYIMFLAGLEMDLSDFQKNRKAGISFGLITFIIPMIIGVISSFVLLNYLPEQTVKNTGSQVYYSEMTGTYYLVVASLLLSSMYASHTLVSYPIVSKYGVNKNRSISITVGGTMITTMLALLVLAVIVGMAKGEINGYFWVSLGVCISIFLFILGYVFPKIASVFFKKYEDSITQYIFVLALVFLGAYLAQLSGLEAIIGAFMVGLSINRFIPKISPLMNRLEFVGNAIFIPFFLISVGMLIDLREVFGFNTLLTAIVMCVVACSSKYFAARITQKAFHLSRNQGLMIFGLSNAQAAATLAAVKIGYDTIVLHTETGELVRLFGDDILNGTIVMILVTCVISSIATETAARKMAIQSESIDNKIAKAQAADHILIPLSNPDTLSSLMDIAVLLKMKASVEPLYVLHVASDSSRGGMDYGKKLLEKAAKIASGTDNTVKMISRYDANVATGIVHAVKENEITEVVLGLHQKANMSDSFFGQMVEKVLKDCNQMTMIVKSVQPLNTVNRLVVVVPAKAQFEIGFVKWYDRVKNICKQIGANATFYAPSDTLEQIKVLASRNKFGVATTYEIFDDWDDFLVLTRDLKKDDLLVIVTSRKDALSYNSSFEKLPVQLSKYFESYSFIVLYPEQYASRTEVEILNN